MRQVIIDLAWYKIRLRELGKREFVSLTEEIITTKSTGASTVYEQFKCFAFSFVAQFLAAIGLYQHQPGNYELLHKPNSSVFCEQEV